MQMYYSHPVCFQIYLWIVEMSLNSLNLIWNLTKFKDFFNIFEGILNSNFDELNQNSKKKVPKIHLNTGSG